MVQSSVVGRQHPCPICGKQFVPIPAGRTTLHHPTQPAHVASPPARRSRLPLIIAASVGGVLVVGMGLLLVVALAALAFRHPALAAGTPPGSTAAPSLPPATPPLDLGETATLGDLRVRIASVSIGHAMRDWLGGDPVRDDDESILVKLHIDNASETKKFTVYSWGDSDSVWHARLSDDLGNDYAPRYRPAFGFMGQAMAEEVYPGKGCDDLLVMGPPVAKAARLTLTLPSQPPGRDSVSFSIPRSAWAK